MIKLGVTGMSCGHCEKAVEKALAQVPGVERVVKVSRTEKQVVLEGNPELDALIAALEAEGYQASAA